ncbi:MAG: PHP domain-containing protein [Longilinea sp.]|nr:PHP domain-containing protein [Longilinea sp.]
MGLADLHIHSIYSYDGTATIPAILKYTAERTQLNVIAVTDHDSMKGVAEAMRLAPHYGLEVVPGVEVSTADGHVLALFVNQLIPPGLSLVETALRVRAAGGICIAAHPLAFGTSSLRFETIQDALQQPGVKGSLVGVEAFNGGLVYTRQNETIAERSRALPLAQVGNSDAHVVQMIGGGATQFEGRSAAELRAALQHRMTQPVAGRGLTGLDVLVHYIPRYLLRKLGWAAWNAHPSAPLTYTRLR